MPTLKTSRSSEWLAAYNEAWEDGTGVEVDPLSEQHVDWYYVHDDEEAPQLSPHSKQPLVPQTSPALAAQQKRDAFPVEWFITPPVACEHDIAEERISQHTVELITADTSGEQQQDEEADGDDDAYTSRVVGLAMLGLYCAQGLEEADCSAAADVALPPSGAAIGSPRLHSLPQRTPSSRARSEFNNVNPQLAGQRSSTSTSASPLLSSTPAYLASPTLSPLTSSPSISTPAFAYSSPASRSPATSTPTSPAAQAGSNLPSAIRPTPNTAQPNVATDEQQRAHFDADMHQRVCQRLRARLAVDGNTLSDKRSSTASTSSAQPPVSTVAALDERAHHDRFAQLTDDSGALCLSASDLPSPLSWLHLGSYLLSTPRVSFLSFHSVCVTSAELEMLGHAALSFIRALSFSDNSIGLRPYTLSKLVDLLAACELLQLEQLAITHNSLAQLDALDGVIEQHPTLRSLRLSNNGVTNEGAATLADAMRRLAARQHFTDFASLALDGNRIDAQGVAALSAARDELQLRTGMDVEVTATDMRRYAAPPASSESKAVSAPMSPLALLPLSALSFPMPLTQTAFDISRVAAASHTAHKRLTVFRALSLKVKHAQVGGVRQRAAVEEDSG